MTYGNASTPPLIPLSYGIISPYYSSPYSSTVGNVFHFIIFQCTICTYYITLPLIIHDIYKYTTLLWRSKLGCYTFLDRIESLDPHTSH
jgi:hypothetical protein